MQWPDVDLPDSLVGDLERAGVDYVVVNSDRMERPIGQALKDRGLRLLAVEQARELYSVR